MTPKHRSDKNYGRKAASRVQRSTVLIVCEGELDEPAYFEAVKNSLGRTSNLIHILGKECQSNPKSVVECAINRMDSAKTSSTRDEYDEVWCVIDVEAPTQHPDLEEALELAKVKNATLKKVTNEEGRTAQEIKVALTNPCFEYWLLLHFEKTGSELSNKAVKQKLKRHLRPMNMGRESTIEKLLPRLNTAIVNAKQVLKENKCGANLKEHNPSTHVHKVVLALLEHCK